MNEVAIFADVQNLYYTVKQQYQCHFNYGAFWEQATVGRSVIKAIAYATDKGDRRQIEFQKILERMGFEIKLTPFLQRRDGSAKGDWDVGIALDMIDYAKQVDTIVLASGDGDFTAVVDKVKQESKVEVEIYGVPDLTATALINSATRFVPIQGHLLLSIPTTW
ncbi:MAG: NYN domain-containing protein [Nitrospirae bacterium]|nr:NYN domain-containing protein [Nitrospirota bacterium]MDA1304341.1 NYN domain-containing protein [Nitrospirota bacterium]